jgi:hypothetical protein
MRLLVIGGSVFLGHAFVSQAHPDKERRILAAWAAEAPDAR